MKRMAFMAAVAACALGIQAHADEAKTYSGPQEAAGNIYVQKFDNEKVRVSEITFKPGDKAAMHTHPFPHFVYVIEPGQLTIAHPDGTNAVVDGKAGDIMWMPAETHEAVNTGTTTLRALVAEIK